MSRSVMTKADIVESVYANAKLSKKESIDVVELVLEALKDRFESGEPAKIHGFGHFHVKVKRPRAGRNPQTGKRMDLPARRVLVFRAAKVLKDAINPRTPPGRDASRSR